MPIVKTNNVIVESLPADWDQFARTGVVLDRDFAICDERDRLKQLQFSVTGVTTGKTVTMVAAGANDVTLTLPSSSCTLASTTATAEYDAGNSGSTLTLDFNNGEAQKVTMTASCTFTFSNPQNGASYVLKLVQGGSGSYTATWPGTVKWAGSAPTLSTSVGKIDLITFYYDGTSYYGNSSIGY